MQKVKNLFRLLMILVVLLVAAGCWEKESEDERLIEEAKQARMAERMTSLLKTAQAAKDASDYEEALKTINEALKLDPKHQETLALKKQVLFDQKLVELGGLKEQADARWAEVQKLDGAQGVDEARNEAGTIAESAVSLNEEKKYDEAIAKYQLLIEKCAAVMKLGAERDSAKERRAEADAARQAAADANAEKDAEKLWSDGLELAESAASVFEQGKFVDAARMWKVAASHLTDAKAWAEGTQTVRTAKAAFDKDAAQADRELLDRFGGEPWTKTKQAVAIASKLAEEGDWSRSVETWEAAQAWLKNAVVTASNGKILHERAQASGNCDAVVERSYESLKKAQESPKSNEKMLDLINAELAAIDKCKTTDWYELLRLKQRKRLDKTTEALLTEKFYYLHPDLVDARDVKPVPLSGLSGGSAEAQQAQIETAEELGVPVEVITRKTGIRMRLIPAGKFMMGSPESERGDKDEQQHEVTISKPFYVSVFEITQGQWKSVKRSNPSKFPEAGDDAPVEDVEWTDAQGFCVSLAGHEGAPRGAYQLPTEAQWEYACRAGTASPFYTGKSEWDFARAGWCTDNSQDTTHKVGMKIANAWGLHDMHGNVWEWCLDGPRTYKLNEAATDPVGESHKSRVIRGGGWYDKAWDGRCANRGTSLRQGVSENDLGFRIVRAVVPVTK
jgi:formylglycine-generating enzyme required for sulfatase activity